MGEYLPSSLAKDGKPLDLSHHLTQETRERAPNPMKAVWKFFQGRPNVISLANGDPHYTLYPLKNMSFEVASLDAEDPVHAWRFGPGASTTLTVGTDPASSVVPLQRAMGYTTGAGLPETGSALQAFTELFHAPPPAPGFVATPTLGNCDGVAKCFRMFGERGDSFLADEFAFTALTSAATACGIKWVPVRIDAGGLVPEQLESILENWNEAGRGKRPHVLYTVPCGQNPTGSTLSLERRTRIYEIAQKYDLVILEDDPYYFLQHDLAAPIAPAGTSFAAAYASTFLPSFLSLDVDGRVLRIDSFSKTLAPGMRLGWITASAAFTERLVALTDASTMHPHGFGQTLILELLGPRGWGTDGFARWLHSLAADYTHRRDHFRDVFNRVMPLELASTDVPQAGMFFWIACRLSGTRASHARRRGPKGGPRTNTAALMEELFYFLVERGVVVMPASIFVVREDDRPSDVDDRLNFFRATFAGTEQVVEDGLARLGEGLRAFFAESDAVAAVLTAAPAAVEAPAEVPAAIVAAVDVPAAAELELAPAAIQVVA